jgi:hypothetical protein
MQSRIALVCLLCLLLSFGAVGQQPDHGGKRQLFVPPIDRLMLAVVSQPDCPLQIESAKLLLPVVGGGLSANYQLRNQGTKPLGIKSVHLLMIGPDAESAWEDRPKDGSTTPLMPRAFMLGADDPIRFTEIVPLTDEIRNHLKTPDDKLAVVVLMIEEIEFADGTTYNAKDAVKELRAYFKNLELQH